MNAMWAGEDNLNGKYKRKITSNTTNC